MLQKTPLALSRPQILAFRQQAASLHERLPAGARSLRRAAWAGLQDSMPRAALLSIHARVAGTRATTWEHSSLVQLWGPRFSAYVVSTHDRALFTLGRLPEDPRGQARAHDTAERLHAFLDGRRLPLEQARRGLKLPHSLRYAAPTGRVLIRWDGARQPDVWTVPAPTLHPRDARLELARRYVHILGPTTPAAFAHWAGIAPAQGRSTFKALEGALLPVRTPVGDAFILAEDEAAFRARSPPAAPARLLPSGDAYFLLWGDDRKLLVPEAKPRAALWTSRVWPGAVLIDGEIMGTWRRAAHEVSVETWRRVSPAQHRAAEAEAASLPLPGLDRPITLRWS